MELHYTNLLIVVTVGFGAPLLLGFFPKVRMPSVVLELIAGILVGPAVLGWVHVDPPVASGAAPRDASEPAPNAPPVIPTTKEALP